MKLSYLLLLLLVVGTCAILFFLKQPSQQLNKDIIVIGTNAEYPPFSFKERDEITGLDIDLATTVLNRMGKPYIIKDMAFDTVITEIQLGKIHVIATGMTPTPDREKQLFFTTPHLKNDQLLIVSHAHKPLKTVDDLKGHSVVVNSGFTADFFVTDIKNVHVLRLATSIEGFMALDAGHVDALVAAESSIQGFLKRYGRDRYSITAIPGESETYALGVSKKYPELFKEIEHTIEEFRKNGTLKAIKQKWNLND